MAVLKLFLTHECRREPRKTTQRRIQAYVHNARKICRYDLMTSDSKAAESFYRSVITQRLTRPVVYLARHGETAWSLSGQHTGLTDLPLTERGERNARRLAERLKGLSFNKVFTSPLQRAKRTCKLAGFGGRAEVDRDLLEWNYGEYESRRTDEIHAERPDWQLFRDGCPGGESPQQV
jgi:hypothetical protein